MIIASLRSIWSATKTNQIYYEIHRSVTRWSCVYQNITITKLKRSLETTFNGKNKLQSKMYESNTFEMIRNGLFVLLFAF